jgi:hypothetical protein
LLAARSLPVVAIRWQCRRMRIIVFWVSGWRWLLPSV